MQEFLVVLAVVVALGGVIFYAAVFLDKAAWAVEQYLNLGANLMIMFIMFFVVAEVILRLVFNSPIPGHLELSELFAPPIIFFALAYTQSTGGHIQMTLVISRLSPLLRHSANVINQSLSVGIYAVLTYFSAKHVYRTWLYDDITMSPPYFLIWPSTAAVTIGLFFTDLRLYLELLQELFPGKIRRVTVDTHKHIDVD